MKTPETTKAESSASQIQPDGNPANPQIKTDTQIIVGAGADAKFEYWAERDARGNAWRAAELERDLMTGRCRPATNRLAIYGLRKGGRKGGGSIWTAAGVNRFESALDTMPWEFPSANSAGRVTPRTMAGYLVGHRKPYTVTLKNWRFYLIEEAGIDRRYLHHGYFLVGQEDREKLLEPGCLIARADYAARLYLALRRLGFPRPHGRNMGAAIARIEDWARINALPPWLRPASGKAAP